MDQQNIWIAYTASNLVAVLFVWAAFKRTKLARLLFFLLFTWACWVNYTTAHQTPEVYIEYADKSIGLYARFINGWFKENITLFVSIIALGQALIAIGMLLKGVWVKFACLGAILFLMAIAPLGVYAAFPFSITMSVACYFVWKNDNLPCILNNHKLNNQKKY